MDDSRHRPGEMVALLLVVHGAHLIRDVWWLTHFQLSVSHHLSLFLSRITRPG